MNEKMKPIIFSGEMIKAILDGRKTQTRRVIKPQPINVIDCNLIYGDIYPSKAEYTPNDYRLAPYQPGDILWVRETWAKLFPEYEKIVYLYKANGGGHGQDYRWRPSIHMPREAARAFLRVTNVRVEWLKDISETDAIAEGCIEGLKIYDGEPPLQMNYKPQHQYMELWDKLNAKRGYSWDSNPWVWVYEFERVTL